MALNPQSYINELFATLGNKPKKSYSPIEVRPTYGTSELVERVLDVESKTFETRTLVYAMIQDYIIKERSLILPEVTHGYLGGFVPRYALTEFVAMMFGVILSLILIGVNLYTGKIIIVQAFTATLIGSALGIVFMVVRRR